jgi:acetyl esterase/lipase
VVHTTDGEEGPNMEILDDARPDRRAPRSGRAACSAPRSVTTAAAVLIGALVLGACAATPTPTWDPTDRLPNTWGRGTVPDVVDIAYDPASRIDDRVADLYLPRRGPARGLILYVHGGGFTGGDRGQLGEHAGPLLRQLDRGFAILNVEYRKDPFPAAVHDVDAALAFARSKAGRDLGIDASTVVVAGHSAGGTIAAVHALGANHSRRGALGALGAVDGWIAISGPLELDGTFPNADYARIAWRAGRAAEASPAALLDRADPPGLVIHGDRDMLIPVAHATIFRDRAARVGFRRLTTEIVSAAPDGCRGHAPICGASIRDLDRFMDRVVAASA